MIIKKAMAMKPDDRYQSVAEMSNDLKLVLLSMPPTTQPPTTNSARPVDPHSTQPDLPQLFESMQNAQATIDQSSRDSASSVPPQQPQPLVAQVSPVRCPRCNAELRRQATFCPQCGFSLANKAPNNMATTTPQTPTFTTPNSTNPSLENIKALPGTSDETRMAAKPNLP